MFVRLSSVRRGGKSYEYAQLVESVRPDSGGAPRHRVVANLGRITDRSQVENLRAAFEANKKGTTVTVTSGLGHEAKSPVIRPRACLRYLDVAVVLETLRETGVEAVLQELLGEGQHEVATDKVVAALVVQRCLAPESKLQAVRWFPRTALPELLGVNPAHFNNTRVHRALESLEHVDEDLMRAMSRRSVEKGGQLHVTFLDVTDTYFEGEGPELCARGKSKEGLIRKKIGIALLCDPEGIPLRWQLMAGNAAEAPTMLEMMRSKELLPWLSGTPVVVDRAMGRTAQIREMQRTDARFITALTRVEYETYCPELPAAALVELQPDSMADDTVCAQEAARRVEEAGFERIADDQYFLDVGEVHPPKAKGTVRDAGRKVPSGAMQVARDVDQAHACGKYGSLAAAARALGHTKDIAGWYRSLLKLPEELQQRVLAGEVDAVSIWEVLRVARQEDELEQRAAFDKLRALRRSARGTRPTATSVEESAPGRPLRCAVYFNPETFVSQRRLAAETLGRVGAHVERLNAQLQEATSRTTASSVRKKLDYYLRRLDLLSCFEVNIEETSTVGKTCLRAELALNKERWRLRQRFDGFTVIVADARVELTARELCRTYRAKDAVETDFQVIKSLLKLRPVRHRTDEKVRAHVSVCMLALLVQRALHARLRRKKVSAQLALELLEPCRLTAQQVTARSRVTYALTHPTSEQQSILRALGLNRLVDPAELGWLTPRASFVTTESPNSS